VSNKMRSALVSQELQKIVKLPHSHDSACNTESTTSYTATCPCECDLKIAPPKIVPPVPILSRAFAPPVPAPAPASTSLTFIHSPFSSVTAPTQPVPVPQLAPPGVPPPAKKPRQGTLSKWILREGTKKPPVLQLVPSDVTVNSPLIPTPVAPLPAAIKAEPIEREIRVCRGTVRITVMDDLSHTYFKGQRVVVEVSHPQRKS